MLSLTELRGAVWDRLLIGPLGQQVIAEHRQAALETRRALVDEHARAIAGFPKRHDQLVAEAAKVRAQLTPRIGALLAECPDAVLDYIEGYVRNTQQVPCELQNRFGEAYAPWRTAQTAEANHRNEYAVTISRTENSLRDLSDECAELLRQFRGELQGYWDANRRDLQVSSHTNLHGTTVYTNAPEVSKRSAAISTVIRETIPALQLQALTVAEMGLRIREIRGELAALGVFEASRVQAAA